MVFVNELVSALIIATVQGLSEWIPVSSSGHIVLLENILGYAGGLTFEVALHFGTLMAIFVYFGKDIIAIVEDLLRGRWRSDNARMGFLLVVASIPAAVVGFLAKDFFDSLFSSLGVVAFGFGITGLFLFIASFDFPRRKKERTSSEKIGYGKAFLIGIAQALAIVPGISRSGATISSGVLLGLEEKNAMKFSFLMSIPVIFGANILTVGNNTLPPELLWATLVSFIVGLMTIHVLFNFVLVKKENFRWFGAYCLLLALIIGAWVLFF